jgi:hypothetical protein
VNPHGANPDQPVDGNEHQPLTAQQDASERGAGSHDGIGAHPDPGPGPDGDPGWQPDEGFIGAVRKTFHGLLGDKRRYIRNDTFWPYLVIRAMPGDKGARALWPPTATWESPDLLLMPADVHGPFDRSQLVAQPVAGRSYRVFVHVWNLGRHPAIGVRVRAWWVQPGFFNPATSTQFPPTMIGGAWVNLGDRTQPTCHQIVEIGTPWTVVQDNDAHECLLAAADCFGDTWSGSLDANGDRHVGQRNLTIASASFDLGPLLAHLAAALPRGADLNIMHAGRAADVVLKVHFEDAAARPPTDLPGVPVPGLGTHLGTLTHVAERRVFVPTDRLEAPEEGFAALATGGPTVGGTLHAMTGEERLRIGKIIEAPSPELLGRVLTDHFALRDLRAGTLAEALGGGTGTAHLLRFVAVQSGQFVGGYSVLVTDSGLDHRDSNP